MDRSSDNSDGAGDPPALEACRQTAELRRVHGPLPAAASVQPRYIVRRAPPRPLVPRAYHAPRPRPVRPLPPLPLPPAAYVAAFAPVLEPGRAAGPAPVPPAPLVPHVGQHKFAHQPVLVIPMRAAPLSSRLPGITLPKFTRAPDLPGWRTAFAKGAKFAAIAAAGYLAIIVVLMAAYRFVNPPLSSLMLQQKLAGQDVTQSWVAIDSISPQIVRAVLLSEDGRFCRHHGVDLLEMQAAIERAGDGGPRGASTISMQVVKNLFLWPSKSYVRKAIEIPLTYLMELLWPKRRIMEVYLNIAEWGPGIFGVGAAAQFHFNKAAGRLNEREAAQLAVALPNPYSRDAGDPGPQTRRLAGDVQNRMRSAYPSQIACVLGSKSSR